MVAAIPARQRRDAYPENAVFRDTGCHLHPSCLTCPFVVCRLETPRAEEKRRIDGMREAIARLRRQGKTAAEIASALCIGERTVWRRLAEI